ncbi:MAG: IS66-like element accessory protein TnpA [Pikeienuella sp.]
MSKSGKRRRWSNEEKRSICLQTTAPGVSVAQVARRYAMNANMIFGWLKDPRFRPQPDAPEGAEFLSVEVGPISAASPEDLGGAVISSSVAPSAGSIEIALAGGHRVKAEGAFDPDVLARLLKGLMT